MFFLYVVLLYPDLKDKENFLRKHFLNFALVRYENLFLRFSRFLVSHLANIRNEVMRILFQVPEKFGDRLKECVFITIQH